MICSAESQQESLCLTQLAAILCDLAHVVCYLM